MKYKTPYKKPSEYPKGMSWCHYKCQKFLPKKMFWKARGRSSGVDAKCKDCVNLYHRLLYHKSLKHNSKLKKLNVILHRKWYEKNRFKTRTHGLVYQALKKGILVKPKKCSECLSRGPLNAHHDDYRKPLAVKWLCVQCHAFHHRKRTPKGAKRV